MKKIINILFLLLVFMFFFSVFKYYLSNTNIKNVNLNRANISQIVKNKISNVPILIDNTNNALEFNSSFSNQIKDDKPRSFWNLLK